MGFGGEIPEIETYCERLEFFDVSGNDLNGEIPSSITKCSGLKYLDLSFNRLNGNIPVRIADLKRLLVIRLANRSIDGTIPAQFGSIEWLEVLDLHNLKLAGEVPDEISNCRFLLELDVSRNSLEGGIPQNLDNMTYLVTLDLHHNQLNGSIPLTIGNLSNIHSLDLSENFPSDSIPFTLKNLKNLTQFNVSYNNLSGAIPSIPSIQQFGFSAFFHNQGLCGTPLDDPCSATPGAHKPKLSASAIVAIVAAALIVTGSWEETRRRECGSRSTPLASTESNVIIGKLVLFSKKLPSRYEDWEAGNKALLDKECLIGGCSIGRVYKTTFEGGITTAVKKLETLGTIWNQEEFEHEIGRLGNLQHPNFVAFQGYYWSSSMQLILSEFVSNGNLHDNLLNYPGTSSHVGNPELNCPRRIQIALGTARALAYLHHDCRPPVLHLNVKSSNILLDKNYNAKLSDYSLGKFLPLLDNYGSIDIHNVVGYIAPECLLGFAENELIQVMKLGLICTCETPLRRPSMAEVVQVLESIRNGLES
ncbi:putative LRR receptor-like serine/threonine-protein kinase [Forsythia ovata]|uniref:LRR receptor-like serine/threonine-protein kinase n=1 Tax=Forsythia ovata TaxID=205694 RepID=A0ABD1WD12_9LAMI